MVTSFDIQVIFNTHSHKFTSGHACVHATGFLSLWMLKTHRIMAPPSVSGLLVSNMPPLTKADGSVSAFSTRQCTLVLERTEDHIWVESALPAAQQISGSLHEALDHMCHRQ
eukprot:gene4734-34489_t